MLSQGVPMLLHGDELGRSQGGNNNGYCQDNDISWIQWVLDGDDRKLLAFTQSVVKLRREHPVFRRRRFFAGSASHGGESGIGDIAWFTPEAEHMDEEAWSDGLAKSLMVFLNGSAIPAPDPRGNPVLDDSFIVMFNAYDEALSFTLPDEEYGTEWVPVIDTAAHELGSDALDPSWQIKVEPRSIVVLRCPARLRRPRASRAHRGGHRVTGERAIISTHRLQLEPDFTLDDAVAQVALPVRRSGFRTSTCHRCSRRRRARSTGTTSSTTPGWPRASAVTRPWSGSARPRTRAGLGLVVDVVPNHMTTPTPLWLNRPLWSVLREGRGSAYASWFDIDWEAQGGRILMPVLGAPLEEALAAGEITVGEHDGEPVVRYYDHVFPLAPGTRLRRPRLR